MSVRRIVTGHGPDGKAVILSDGAVPRIFNELGPPGLAFMEVWETRATPAPIAPDEPEPTDHDLRLLPPANGVRIRVVDLPPEGAGDTRAGADPRAVFEKIGATHAWSADAKHPFMHRTETVDYGIVLEGEVTLILDRGETTVRAGDIVVQRGTNHAWANRSKARCRIAFVLIDGRFTGGIEGR